MDLVRLKEKAYPGRGIIIARLVDAMAVVYILTGRSKPSQARRLFEEEGAVRIDVTDPDILEQGDSRLLCYDAMRFYNRSVVVSNGRQTDAIGRFTASGGFEHESPYWFLKHVFAEPVMIDGVDVTTYEPDSNHTPRISGVVRGRSVALHIVRRAKNGDTLRSIFEPKLDEGEGVFISTYEDGSTDKEGKLVPFQGGPLLVQIDSTVNPKQFPEYLLDRLWESLRPDVRVSVAVALVPHDEAARIRVFIHNKHDAI